MTTVDQNGKPMTFGRYTLHHCKQDNVWQQVCVHTVGKVKELQRGACRPGQGVIVVTETTQDGMTTVRHHLHRCNSAGLWVRIGG